MCVILGFETVTVCRAQALHRPSLPLKSLTLPSVLTFSNMPSLLLTGLGPSISSLGPVFTYIFSLHRGTQQLVPLQVLNQNQVA